MMKRYLFLVTMLFFFLLLFRVMRKENQEIQHVRKSDFLFQYQKRVKTKPFSKLRPFVKEAPVEMKKRRPSSLLDYFSNEHGHELFGKHYIFSHRLKAYPFRREPQSSKVVRKKLSYSIVEETNERPKVYRVGNESKQVVKLAHKPILGVITGVLSIKVKDPKTIEKIQMGFDMQTVAHYEDLGLLLVRPQHDVDIVDLQQTFQNLSGVEWVEMEVLYQAAKLK